MSNDDFDRAGNDRSGRNNSTRQLIERRAVWQGAASLSVLALGAGAAKAQTATPSLTSFTIGVLPDAEFYSRYATHRREPAVPEGLWLDAIRRADAVDRR